MPDIQIAGATYPDVPAIVVPKSGGGTARFVDPDTVLTWEGIIATRGEFFPLGGIQYLVLGTIDGVNCGVIRMQKVAENEANAKSVWMAKDFLATARPMDSQSTTDGGWGDCAIRTWLNGALLSALPHGLPNAIVEMSRYSRIYTAETSSFPVVTFTDKIWIPSVKELNGTNTAGGYGPSYAQWYPTQDSRVKTLGVTGSTYRTWLRDVSSSSMFYGNAAGGSAGTGAAPTALGGITLCFGL